MRGSPASRAKARFSLQPDGFIRAGRVYAPYAPRVALELLASLGAGATAVYEAGPIGLRSPAPPASAGSTCARRLPIGARDNEGLTGAVSWEAVTLSKMAM